MSRFAALDGGQGTGHICPDPEQTSPGLGRVLPLSISPFPHPDRTWVEKIREGDRKAFAALFHALYPSLCSLVNRRIGAPDVAEELVQDIFARIWEQRDQLDPEQSITRYLYRAARNQALKHLRHRNVVSRSQAFLKASLRQSQPTPEDQARYREVSDAAQDAIEQLPDRCREIFLLSRQGEMKYSEIARTLGISVKTVETQMGRALRALRSALLPYLS